MVLLLKLTLYHASWCGHCVTFLPEWQKLEKYVSDMGYKYNGVKIHLVSYDDKDLKNVGGGKINDTSIEGYPTIKFGLTLNKMKKEYEYSKEQKSNVIINYIKKVCDGMKRFTNKHKTG